MKHQEIQKNAALQASGSHRKQRHTFKNALHETKEIIKHPSTLIAVGMLTLGAAALAKTQEKPLLAANKPVASATRNEPKQVRMAVPANVNPFTVEFDGQNVNFKNFVSADGKQVMGFDATITNQLQKITGKPNISPAEGEVKKVGDAAFVYLKNGIIGVFPDGDGKNSTKRGIADTVEQITSRYENETTMAAVALTKTGLIVVNPFLAEDISLPSLFNGRQLGKLDIIQDPINPNCALITENGTPILRVYTDGKELGKLLEYYKAPLLGARE